MSTPNDTLNIYLNNKNIKEEVLSESSPYEKYIILMNDTLQNENRNHITKIKELEDKIEEMETELGSAEIRNNNIKGLLKNFHEIDKWRKEKSDIETEIIVKTWMNTRNFKKNTDHDSQLLLIFIILIHAFYWYFSSFYYSFCLLLNFGLMIIILKSYIEKLNKTLKLSNFSNKLKRIDEINEEITNTLKAQDYIHEFLDNQ